MRLRAGRTPPGVRELKLNLRRNKLILQSRTPPGVRELKREAMSNNLGDWRRRTPPGVRELKQHLTPQKKGHGPVAPLPGCVN